MALIFSKNIFVLFLSMIFINASERIIFPVLALVFFDAQSGLFVSDLSFSDKTYYYGLCLALVNLGNLMGAPLLSSFSDKYGRKNILILSFLGLFLAGLISSLAIFLSILYLFMIGIFILGLFARINPIAQAIIGDANNHKIKLMSMGYLQSAIAFGAFLGPILGGYFAHFYFNLINFSAAFILSACLSFLAFLICYFFFKETIALKVKSKSLFALAFASFRLLKNPVMRPYVFLLAFSQITWSFYYQYAPAILKVQNQFSAKELGFFIGLMALWVMLGSSFGLYALNRRLNLLLSLRFSLGMQFLALILFILAFFLNANMLAWVSALPMAMGDVIAFVVLSTHYSNHFKYEQGQAMGACYLNSALMWAMTAFLGGYLMSLFELLPILLALLSLLIALYLSFKK